ncbi:MAG: hypothetical protein KF805_05635 [Phycisphaeraceae bacterium]|nr:hypothetical protein [Phycisphaeraceae bacterium]
MHSDQTKIESQLRLARSAGMMTPPSTIGIDTASLPDRPTPSRRINASAMAALGIVSAAAIGATVLLVTHRSTPGPSASEAVALSLEAIPQSGADVTRRILQPVRREMQSLALHSRRAAEALRGGLQSPR